jgi:hypothetical protein
LFLSQLSRDGHPALIRLHENVELCDAQLQEVAIASQFRRPLFSRILPHPMRRDTLPTVAKEMRARLPEVDEIGSQGKAIQPGRLPLAGKE